MKKIIIFIVVIAAAYFVYEYLIKEKEVLLIKAEKSISTAYSMDADAPALAPTRTGSVAGTVKNISDKPVRDIVLKFRLDAKPVEAKIPFLDAGEEKAFTTQSIMLQYADPSFFLEDKTFIVD